MTKKKVIKLICVVLGTAFMLAMVYLDGYDDYLNLRGVTAISRVEDPIFFKFHQAMFYGLWLFVGAVWFWSVWTDRR